MSAIWVLHDEALYKYLTVSMSVMNFPQVKCVPDHRPDIPKWVFPAWISKYALQIKMPKFSNE